VDDVGKPVAGASVGAWADGDQVAEAASDSGGRFRLTRVASKKPVVIGARAAGHEYGTAKDVALDAKAAKVELRRLGRLSLRVLGPDGKPLARVLVRTLVAEDAQRGDASWFTQGPTPLAVELPVGKVEVVVEAEGCASQSVATYEVEPGASHDLGTVTLEKGAPKPAKPEGDGEDD
jgi:hypothetical protein